MPLHNSAYPPGPYRFYNREFVIIKYRTDPALLHKIVPEPLVPAGDGSTGGAEDGAVARYN